MPVLRKTLAEYAFVALTILVGLAVTISLTYARHQAAELKIAQQFSIAANDRINVITRLIQDNIAASHSVVAFFQASDNVERTEFATFASQILGEHPYIEALEWAPRVVNGDRATYTASARKTIPDYAFKDIEPDGTLVTARERKLYYPIYYIEPVLDYTARVFGVDFMTNPVRRKAITTAMATGQTAATARVILLSSHKPGLLFFSPVVKSDEFKGFVVSVVQIHTLVAHAIEPLNKEGLNIIAYDVTENDAGTEPVFIHASRLKAASDEEVLRIYNASALREEATINVAGRKWRITVVPSQGYFLVGAKGDVGILLAGLVFTLMVAYFMVSRIRENVRIQGIVELRTEELELLARYDPLTELANRRLFLELLESALARAGRAGSKAGIVYIDLNDFKPVNDWLGHAAGDALLKAFSARVAKVLRGYDTMARLGGDEFAILVDDMQTALDCEALLARLLAVIHEPYDIAGEKIKVGASMGVAIYPDHAKTLDDLLAAADNAMYQAKKDKSKPYVIFNA